MIVKFHIELTTGSSICKDGYLSICYVAALYTLI
jgi:hypothetical protein